MAAVDHRRQARAATLLGAEVVWTDGAIADVADIVAWSAPDRPRAAARLAERLQRAGKSLDLLPRRGRMISRGRRELVINATYLIRYRIEGGRVFILEVRHGRRAPE